MRGTCWLCGYALSHPLVKYTYTTRKGKTYTRRCHVGCLEQHLAAKERLVDITKRAKA